MAVPAYRGVGPARRAGRQGCGPGGVSGMAEPAALSFGGLLRQLRAEANLTQEELAEAAQLSPRSVSDLERGISRTARKDTALLLAGALGLAGPARELFLAAARGRAPAAEVLAAREGRAPGAGHQVAPRTPACPYRGLLPFAESDAEVFYGRERLAAELAARLAARASRGGLVVVTGASGAGKSSLLRAGLLPILARGQQVPGSDRWPRIVMTPTKDPLTELATRLAAVGGPDALTVRDGLARHPGQAHLAIRSAVLAAAARRDEQPPSGNGAARLVLIVDQFEQVFTLNPDAGGEAARQAFITALCAAAAEPGRPGAGAARGGGDRGARGFLRPVRRRSRAGGRAARRPVRGQADDRIRAPGGDHRPGRGGRAAHRPGADRDHLGGPARGGRGPLGRGAAAAVPGDGADLGTARG